MQELLVIEDDSTMASSLGVGLERAQYRVTVAQDGPRGYELARDGRYHGILLDVMLPGMDGFEVARRLRSGGNRTPILMLTARDAEVDVVRALDGGVEDYLTKPFRFAELCARLRAMMRKTEPAEAPLNWLDLAMDRERHEVRRQGQVLSLTKTEYLLLESLLQSQGGVVTRKALMDAGWEGVHVEENSLDAAMSSLRTRVDKGHERRLIQTVRGFGYRLGGAGTR